MALKVGLALCGEEHGPDALIDEVRRAEDDGFASALIADDLHAASERQGQTSFVWTVLGPIARETTRLVVGTGVTCPMIRLHPAIIAQAAATTEALMPGRFFLGIGTGEALNDLVPDDRWPPSTAKLSMLEEAVRVLRTLWKGGDQSHHGEFYTVEHAELHDLPDAPPPIAVTANGIEAAELAGRLGTALVAVSPQAPLVDAFVRAGGDGRRYGRLTVCWAASEDQARETVRAASASAARPAVVIGDLAQSTPFEPAGSGPPEIEPAEMLACGPDPECHLRALAAYAEAGFDHVFVRQVGSEQDGFRRFYRDEILPQLGAITVR
jgi:G6PDH family F420-dependent oxidoreductase